MTKAVRLVFDDCLSRNAVEPLKRIVAFSRGAVEVAHLADFSLAGQTDDDWIPKFKESGWTVVTTDRGKKNHGGKLPVLCGRNGVTHIMMSGAVHQRNQFDKLRALFEVWPAIVEAATSHPGRGHLLKVKNRGGDYVELALATESLAGEELPKTQQTIIYPKES